MKIIRSVTHRGNDVGTAGYFSVLRTNSWFAASRYPDRFPNLHARIEAAAQQKEQEEAGLNGSNDQLAVHLDLNAPKEPLPWMRLTATVLLAFGIISFLYWWIFMNPQPLFK